MSEVLIVGAGPTGLMMACQLAIYQIPFRIIDKNEDHATQSRAIVIHAASMEIFSQMGISGQFLQCGKQVSAINYIAGKKQIHIPLFSKFGSSLTQFPFLLALEQSKTEKILLDFLKRSGHNVERNVELVSISQNKETVTATLRHADGKNELTDVKWLIGTDGAKSVARHLLGIPFGGETYPLDLFVLDCKVNWQLKDDELFLALSDTSFAGFFPLPNGRCRVISFVPEALTGKTDIAFEDVRKGFADRMQMDVELYDPDWISTYHAHHRYVSQFKKGRCFLAGDAAHVHSPVGAQGMNTGLQDACNLAWKLAFVIKKQASGILLSTYQQERLPFARQLVKTTDRAFGIVVSNNPFVRIIRTRIAPYVLAYLVRVRFLATYIFKAISQIGITYTGSALTKDDFKGLLRLASTNPGKRLPFITYQNISGKSVNIQQLVKEKMQLLLFYRSDSNRVQELVNMVSKYPQVSVSKIQLTPANKKLQERLGIKKEGYYLIRPDLYIAYRCNSLNTGNFGIYLRNLFNIEAV